MTIRATIHDANSIEFDAANASIVFDVGTPNKSLIINSNMFYRQLREYEAEMLRDFLMRHYPMTETELRTRSWEKEID